MIKANEAWAGTQARREELKKKESFKLAMERAKLYNKALGRTEDAIKNAVRLGNHSVQIEFQSEELLKDMIGDYSSKLEALGYSVSVHVGDDGDGYEIKVTWEGKQ